MVMEKSSVMHRQYSPATAMATLSQMVLGGCFFRKIPAMGTRTIYSAVMNPALPEVVAQLSPNEGTWVHTAGSMPMALFAGHAKHYGVCYPLQTFSKTRTVDVSKVPFFIEGSDAETEERLCALVR